MVLTRFFLVFNLFLIVIAAGCGGSSSRNISQIPPPPVSADPSFGTAGNVLISDRGFDKDGTVDYVWVGFNSAMELQKFLAGPALVGGQVVTPANNSLNFYFDPNTTTSAEIAIPEEVTLIDNLKADPSAVNLLNGTHNWLVHNTVEQVLK